MEGPILVHSVNRLDHLHSLVRQDLRDLGVKLPKSKKIKKLNQSISQDEGSSKKLFGSPLCFVPTVFMRKHGDVPTFLIEAAKIVESHIDCEGIFRKSGSLARQKELRLALEAGKPIDKHVNIHDLTVLIKQFFRDLPEPLFTPLYHDAFIKCYQLPTEKEPLKALLHACLLLPLANLGTLRFILHLLAKVASHSDKNKMTPNNLALVLTPNFMHSNKGTQKMSSAEEKMLSIETSVIELLIRNSDSVGMVNVPVQQQLNLMAECFNTDDDLDASDDNTLEDSQNLYRKKKRKRSSSLSGIVNSIAQGFAKLRRSTDGKSINVSSTSAYLGEMSLSSNASMSMNETHDSSITTPCVMRKQQPSGENAVAFSVSKKKAILDNLQQKSALANTPFTPASTVKKRRHDESSILDISETPRLSETSPCIGSKTPRVKLNLFGSPSSKKMKRNSSVTRLSATNPIIKTKKHRSLFKRLSGGRGEKDGPDAISTETVGERLAALCKASPKTAHVDPNVVIPGCSGITRSVSSPTLPDSEASFHSEDSHSLNKGFIDESDIPKDSKEREQRAVTVRTAKGKMLENGVKRSKSEDSPLQKRSKPSVGQKGSGSKGGRGTPKSKVKALDKSLIGEPRPVVVPVVSNALDLHADKELRRSRRDEYEKDKDKLQREDPEGKSKGDNEDSDEDISRSPPSHGSSPPEDSSFMDAVFKPPHGFGDQTILLQDTSQSDIEVDVVSDVLSDSESDAGFSTISGGTVMRRTESGHYRRQEDNSDSGSFLSTATSYNSAMKPPSTASTHLMPSVSKDSLLSTDSHISSVSSSSASGRSLSADSGKGSLVDRDSSNDRLSVGKKKLVRQKAVEEDTYVTLRHKATTKVVAGERDGEYVSLQMLKKESTQKETDSNGMLLLCENYKSEEDSSSPTGLSYTAQDCISVSSEEYKEIQNMPTHPDMKRKKSTSAEDLKSPKVTLPPRPHSVHSSPARKFNYKPHLEITRETHKMLSRAGYLAPSEKSVTSKDIQVPVRSPKRSSQREELMVSLRSSFRGRHSSRESAMGNSSLSHKEASYASEEESSSSRTSSKLCNSFRQKNSAPTKSAGAAPRQDHQTDASLNLNDRQLVAENVAESISTLDDKPSHDTDSSAQQLSLPAVPEHIGKVAELPSKFGGEDEEMPELHDKEDSFIEAAQEEGANTSEHSTVQKVKAAELHAKTLSGFLDDELKYQQSVLQIKRAAVKLAKHDSVLKIKEQKAGAVAENVKHFSDRHRHHHGPKRVVPLAHQRASSPLKIPNIFHTGDEALKFFNESTNSIREKIGTKDFLKLPNVPPTPKRDTETRSNSPPEETDMDVSGEDSLSEANTTVLEVNPKSETSDDADDGNANAGCSDGSANTECGEKTKNPSLLGVPALLSESLMETINDICTPMTDKLSNEQEVEKAKSPLQESTNTAQSLLDSPSKRLAILENPKLRTIAGHTPRRVPMNTEGPCSSYGKRRHHVKRLNAGGSPRRRAPLSPHRRPKSPGKTGETSQKLQSVPIHLDEEKTSTD